jgi:type IV pilus assembly protein PilF
MTSPASPLRPLVTCVVSLSIALLSLGAGGVACRTGPTEKELKMADDRKALAVDHMNQGRHRQALRELLRAEKLSPDDPHVQHHLGLVYAFGFERYDDARAHLERAIELREDYSEAQNLYGVTLMREERYAEAVPYFKAAMSNLLYETPQFAQQNLGWSLYKSGAVDEGLEHLEDAVASAPDLCGAYFWLGVGTAEQGRLADAARWWEGYLSRCDSERLKAFVPASQRADVQYRLGMAYLKLGDGVRAREALQSCVERFGRQPVARECQKSLDVIP